MTKQAIWQIYLPCPKYIPRPTTANALLQKPNYIHQADLLFLPHDTIRKKVYKYALTISDEASKSVARLKKNYKRSPLTWPKILKVDPGIVVMASVNVLMSKKGVTVQRGEVGNQRAQGIVERLNKTLAERLFSH